jgi:CxxC-x17-CxxC domain-containing protein
MFYPYSGSREMHGVTCDDCGLECNVPFKPNGRGPVYCPGCYRSHRMKRF